MGDRERKGRDLKCSKRLVFGSDMNQSACGQVSSFLWMDPQKLTDQVTAPKEWNSGV